MKQRYFHQIDTLKALAIVSVILMHGLPTNQYLRFYTDFHIRQAVPVFMVIMGLNAAMSFRRRNLARLRDYYSLSYFLNKFHRYIVPFVAVFLLALAITTFKPSLLRIGIVTMLGFLPIYGPGDYFISLLLQFILIAPFLFWLFERSPLTALILMFSVDLAFELIVPKSGLNHDIVYNSSIIRYLFAIGLGFWIAGDNRIFSKRNSFLLIGFALSFAYIVMAYLAPSKQLYFDRALHTQNLISYFYPSMMVLLGLNFLPATQTLFMRLVNKIGKASYHILFVQILYYGLNPNIQYDRGGYSLFVVLPLDLVVSVAIGLAFYQLNERINLVFRPRLDAVLLSDSTALRAEPSREVERV